MASATRKVVRPEAHPFWVTVHGERGEGWQKAVGQSRFPVRSPIPVMASLPGRSDSWVYLVATEKLTLETLGAIARHLARKFGGTPAEVLHDIHAVGLPILAEDCSVVVPDPVR